MIAGLPKGGYLFRDVSMPSGFWARKAFGFEGGYEMGSIVSFMERALDGAWLRHEVLANNVANSETPGYKRQELDFRGYLAKALSQGIRMAKTHPAHLSGIGPGEPVIEQDLSSITPDGQSVDIDKEMAEVSTNAIYYGAVSSQYSAYLSLLRKAITEGRR